MVLGELPFFFLLFVWFFKSPPGALLSLNKWLVNDLGKEYGKTGKEITLDALGRLLECYF